MEKNKPPVAGEQQRKAKSNILIFSNIAVLGYSNINCLLRTTRRKI